MEKVDPLIVELLDSWPTIPAFVRSESLDVLASNELARALSPSFEVGVNLARFTFLDSLVQDGSARGDDVSGHVVSFLRALTQRDPDDRAIHSLVGELAAQSDEFARTWAADLRPANYQTPVIMRHPRVGDLELVFHQLTLPAAPSQLLVIVQVAPGSESENAIFALAAEIDVDSE